MTSREIIKKATSSPDAALQFIVDTQYDSILTRAIGAKVVNSDVGPEQLYEELKKLVSAGDIATFNELLGGDVDMDGLSPAAQGAMQWALDKARTPDVQLRMMRSEQQGGGSGWTPENTNSALSAFTALVGGIIGLFGPEAPADNGSGNNSGPSAPVAQAPQTNWLPWVIGGGMALLLVVMVVVLARRK